MSKDKPAPRHIVVLCHPDKESFNASVAHRYCTSVRAAGHDVCLRDLYAMNFDPVLRTIERPGPTFKRCRDVEVELEVISGADVLVLVYPIWFGAPPAMLKGYIDRVLGSGVPASALRTQSAGGVLAGKRLVSFTSSATTNVWLSLQGQPRSLENILDRYLTHAFQMLPPQHHHYGLIAPDIDALSVQRHLSDVDMHVRTLIRDMTDAKVA